MIIPTPNGYPDRFTSTVPQPGWKKTLFNPGRTLQSAELNEVQSMLTYQFSCLADSLYQEGAYTFGGDISTAPIDGSGGYNVTFAAGRLYAYGYFHDIGAATVGITGVGTETISLIIGTQISTYLTDTTLTDPVQNAEAYTKPGADRLLFTYSFVRNSTNGILVATFINGQLQAVASTNNIIDQILALMAQRTYETSGSFVATAPVLSINDIAAYATNPAQMQLTVQGGVAYPKGYRVSNTKTQLPVLRPLTGQSRVDEAATYASGTTRYTLQLPPVLGIDSVQANVQTASFGLTRGSTVNGSDAIPSLYQPVVSIVSVSAGAHTYVANTDYVLAGNYIQWLAGGTAPSAGAAYNVVVVKTSVLVKALRTQTTVSAEVHASIASSGTTNLANADIDLTSPFSIENTTTSTALIQGTDYTIAAPTGHITWLNRPTGDNISVNYSYWAHTTEGDYVGRDSFIDASGDVLYNSYPSLTINGNAVDYSSQIAFETSSGITPVNTTQMLISYEYALGRVDTLAWKSDGTLWVFPGVPGVAPNAPGCSTDYVAIADINLPPLCVASAVTFQPYNNVTMYETDLRILQNQVLNLMYDIAQFQLASDTSNIPTATNKIGIFADPLTGPYLADTTNGLFAGTFDFLAGSFRLPRTQGQLSPTVSSLTNALAKEDIYLNAYNEITSVTQVYASKASTINLYGQVNTQAKIVLSPSSDVQISETLTINGVSSTLQIDSASVTNPLLMANLQIGNSMLGNVNIPAGYTGTILDGNSDFLDTNIYGNTIAGGLVWGDIIANSTVSVGYTCNSKTVQVTGTGFRANDRAIVLTLDNVPLALTPTGSTVAETSGLYPGAVTANAGGGFTAQFTVPAGIATGPHNIQMVSHTFADITATSSYATAIYSATAYVSDFDINVTTFWYDENQGMVPTCYMPLYLLCARLNIGPPTAAMLNCVNGPIAYLIATVISEAIRQGYGSELNASTMNGSLVQFFAATTYKGIYPGSGAFAYPGVSSLNFASTNITSNAQILINQGVAYFDVSLCSIATANIDPLAQTFTLTGDSFVSSVNLYFAIKPTTAPVKCVIAETSNGIPTKTYVASIILPTTSVNVDAVHGAVATNFAFAKPAFLKGGTEYAIIAQTDDSTAAIWIASLGSTDVNGRGLISSNPATGVLLQSPNASTWTPLQGQDLKFDLNVANFTSTSSIINFGAVNFAFASSVFSFYMPFSIPSQDCSIVYQYSLNNTEWVDFSPTTENDLGNAVSTIYLRVLLNGTNTLSPTLGNCTTLLNYIWQTAGCYIHREFDLPSAESEYVDMYYNVILPGSTSAVPSVSYDHGVTWNALSEITGDATLLDASTNMYQRHFEYYTGGVSKQDILTKIVTGSSVNYVTPTIEKIRVIAR